MRNRDGNSEKGRVKFRFLEFEVEGGTPAIQEGLRNIAAALSRANGTPLKPVPSGSGRALTPKADATRSASTDQMSFEELAPAEVDAEVEPSQPENDESVASQEASTGRQKTVRHHRTPTILNIDLNAGSTPLKAFIAQKNPDTESKKYLVVAAWLKEELKIDAITTDHIYTCFRWMSWNVPDDVGSPLRGMKKQGWFRGGDAKGTFEITHVGLGKVNEMPNG